MKTIIGTICPQQVRAELEQELAQLELVKKRIVNSMVDMNNPTPQQMAEFTANGIARLVIINQLRQL